MELTVKELWHGTIFTDAGIGNNNESVAGMNLIVNIKIWQRTTSRLKTSFVA